MNYDAAAAAAAAQLFMLYNTLALLCPTIARRIPKNDYFNRARFPKDVFTALFYPRSASTRKVHRDRGFWLLTFPSFTFFR